MIKIKKAPEFEVWYEGLREKEQTQIDARLERIQNAGYLEAGKKLG
jgi:putative component of toxin-antitoxin plasmid stabilization module